MTAELKSYLSSLVKTSIGLILFKSGLYRQYFRNKAVITCFHRVDDRLIGDELTCGIKEFDRYLAFFKRYFRVVGLPELLDRIANGADVSGYLAITFDDGYRDNRTNAAPALKAHGLPACFFITTGFIGSQTVPWWDRELPVRLDWMNWDEVRALRADGFDIGAHTVTHIDMGTVDEHTARLEMRECLATLQQELGERVVLFGYPYGREDAMSERNREVVREFGLRCCMSAFGGTVRTGEDLYQIKRQPVSNWFKSTYQFGFEMAMER